MSDQLDSGSITHAPGYSRTYQPRWADLDPNGHMRLSAYADYATDVRFNFLAEHGFAANRFQQLGFGPVVMKEENHYLREVGIGETITVTMQAAGLSADGARWRVLHTVFKANGEKAATSRLEGGWLDLKTRRLIPPPSDLLQALQGLSRTADYAELPPLRLPVKGNE